MSTRGVRDLRGYEPFFGLSEPPFSIAPDPRFLFESASHVAALAEVAYAVKRREPVVVVTGEIGTGETLLCRTVLQRLERKTFISVIDDPQLGRDALVKQLLRDFGIGADERSVLNDADRHAIVQALLSFLRSLSSLEAHAVVIVDEAQHMQPAVLEQLRLLSNVDDARGSLLQIVLVGQTDLGPLLSRSELRQLRQRVSRRLTLQPLNAAEVRDYVEHRLARARAGARPSDLPGAPELAQELAAWNDGKPGVEFSAAAVERVAALSGGVPRVINILCDRALEAACSSHVHIVDTDAVEAAAQSLELTTPTAEPAVASAAIVDEAAETPAVHTEPPPSKVRQPEPASDNREPPPRDTGVRAPDVKTEAPQKDPQKEPAIAMPAAAPAPSTRLPRYLGLAAVVAIAAGIIVSGLRFNRPPTAEAPSQRPPAPASTNPGPLADPGPAGAQPVPAPSAPPTPPAPDRDSPSSAPAPATAALSAERFEVVVASFRTETRADSVVAEVAALGLPATRRTTEQWQQVVAGPFGSRADAEQAQQRIHQAGLTGTQIVPAAP